ncbi:hypothetical protein SDC9_124126 [bioreactor metagenome]|uniref:Uncharacterized protein n=1 Tax=bioreactor metagenome TaxID=1076179 RepID=A0A645CJK0_9ZZZZ
MFLRHDVGYGLVEVRYKAEVAVGDDADEADLVVNDRHARYVIMLHESDRLTHGIRGVAVEGVHNDAGFGTFYLVDLDRLLLYRKVPVHDADAALARERYRETSLGDGVHRGAAYRDVEVDLRRQLR